MAKLLIAKSARHAWLAHPRNPQRQVPTRREYKEELAIGNAAHKLLLNRGKHISVINAPDMRGAEARMARDAAWANGQEPCLRKHYDIAYTMAEIARERLCDVLMAEERNAHGLEEFGREAVITWAENGVWMRSMIDLINPDETLIIDYKTTGTNIAPHVLPWKLVDDGWDIQAAFQERGLNHLFQSKRRDFWYLVQENTPPHDVVVCSLTESVLTMGRKRVAFAVDRWAAAMKSKQFPGFPQGLVWPEYPGSREAAWLDRETTEQMPPDLLMAG